jgi:hypothetical protein
MKLLKIIVDKLPIGCDYCNFRNGKYCPVKGTSSEDGQEWIGMPNGRHEDCPLETEELRDKFERKVI